MISWFKYHFSVFTCFARLAIQRQLEYPLFLISWGLMIPIHYFGGIWMLKVLVERFQPLAGWSFEELSFVYGLGLLSHAIMVVLFIQSWNIEGMVIRGEFDRLMLRPLNVFFQFSIQYINFIGLIDLIPGTIIFLYASRLVNFQWSLINVFTLILVLVGGVLIRASIYTIMGCISFWTKKSRSLVFVGLTLLERTTMYPLTIYPYMIQMIFTFLIPVGFICFYPASALLAKDTGVLFPYLFIILSPIVGLLMFILTIMFFKKGLRIYESAGS